MVPDSSRIRFASLRSWPRMLLGLVVSFILLGKPTPKITNLEYWERTDGSHFPNGKSWVTQYIFKRYLEQFNNSIEEPIILLLDIFFGHKVPMEAYGRINVVYLPPNSTSVTQPLDCGIISILKSSYRKEPFHIILITKFVWINAKGRDKKGISPRESSKM